MVPKQLDPELLGNKQLQADKAPPSRKLSSPRQREKPFFSDLERDLTDTLYASKSELEAIKVKLEQVESRVEYAINELRVKSDQTSKRLALFEEAVRRMLDSARDNQRELLMKIRDRGQSQVKIEGLMDKQLEVINSFESRMRKFQKQSEQREVQILNLKSLLEEARRELARLKGLRS